MRIARVRLALGALVLSSGCATIVHGPHQTVTVTSDPSGAAVIVLSKDGVKSTPGVTPIKLDLPRRDPHITVRLEKDGCAPVEVHLKRTTSGWVFTNLIAANPMQMQGYSGDNVGEKYSANVLIGVPLMFATDFATGGAYNLPKAIDVPLCK